MKKWLFRVLPPLLFVLAGAALGAAGMLLWGPAADLPQAPQITARSPAPAPPAETAAAPQTPVGGTGALQPEGTARPAADPEGALAVSEVRADYGDGDLRLIIPKLGVDIPILDGVDEQTLLRGAGLYDYAQLPWEAGANVSVAGHRNGLRGGRITDDMPFYYINTLTEGDYLYLTDGVSIYQYQWELTWVIEADNWDPIRTQAHACLTLTTCTPIGVADHRLVVRGALVRQLDYDAGYPFPSNVSEEVSSS